MRIRVTRETSKTKKSYENCEVSGSKLSVENVDQHEIHVKKGPMDFHRHFVHIRFYSKNAPRQKTGFRNFYYNRQEMHK